MAKLTITPRKAPPPPKKTRRARVTVQTLMTLVAKTTPEDIVKALRQIEPVRRTLLGLLDMLKNVGSHPMIMKEVLAYCRERSCDPDATPIATLTRLQPSHDKNDRRVFKVQREQRGRPFMKVPLRTLEGSSPSLKRVELTFTRSEVNGKPMIQITAA